MASSSAGLSSLDTQLGLSSSQSPSDDKGGDGPVAGDRSLYSLDPLDDDSENIVSFKRKQKQKPKATDILLKYLPTFPGSTTSSRSDATFSPRSGTPRQNGAQGQSQHLPEESGKSRIRDMNPVDWYVEGPGRRVGYEDMTAIDWIFEYTKERQRIRDLYSSATGLIGYVQQMLDASQIWVVLILTGLTVGFIAAAIDIASDWLGDIKNGYCSAGDDGGKFYLNKHFCCWGYDEWSQCHDWVPWATALHVTSSGGIWIVEYIIFVVYSVSRIKIIVIEFLIRR
jgi:chloride channel 3/4/5